jgi:hypothetical protein|tara:strand:- start:216 stop:500 length:285 start_codon:yes stop_codon:yes gene_type:complete
MLIINGTATLMQDTEEFIKGTQHQFNMFSREMPFEQQLTKIEAYLVNRGWDNINVLSNGVINNAGEITHSVLKQAYQKAHDEGFAVTINNQPLT